MSSSFTADMRVVDDETQGLILDILDDIMEQVRGRTIRAITVSYDRELYETGESPLWRTFAPGMLDITLDVEL